MANDLAVCLQNLPGNQRTYFNNDALSLAAKQKFKFPTNQPLLSSLGESGGKHLFEPSP